MSRARREVPGLATWSVVRAPAFPGRERRRARTDWPKHMTATVRTENWLRALCAVLFLATFLNYANRVTLTQNSVEIKRHFQTDDAGYGRAEAAFGYGFALGGLLFGLLADLVSIRWLYPAVVVAWSACGGWSAHAGSLNEFAWLRFLLGLFEAGHWPCSLRMTQRSFAPHQRTWGNGILQSGAAAGQVLVPQVIQATLWLGAGWQRSFEWAALAGPLWAGVWLLIVRERDVQRPVLQTDESARGAGRPQEIQEIPFWRIVRSRRWWLLLVTVVCINVPWHALRVWMPDTLQTWYGYDRSFVDHFTSLYYLSTFAGSLATGAVVAWLSSRGWNVHRARMTVFGACAILVALLAPAMLLPAGGLLLGIQLLVAFGSLGVAPIYYSLNQELSGKSQGKVGGSLSFLLWCLLALMQRSIGEWVKVSPQSRPVVFACVALLPALATVALVLGWGRREPPVPG